MRKLNYLMSMFAIVLALGVMSCDPNENEVVPVPPVEDEITLATFDGDWINVSTDYQGTNYDASTICGELTSITWQRTDFNIRSTDMAIDFVDVCRSFPRDWSVTFDSETLMITVTGSFDQKYQITKYDLESSPKTMSIKLVSNGGENTMPENITYNLER